MPDLATRAAAAIRHFALIAHSRGFLDALARSGAFLRRRVRRILANTARRRERRAARRIPSIVARPRERFERPNAAVRIAVESSADTAHTNATLRGLERLRDEASFSYELVTGAPREALAALAVTTHEPYLAYLPAGVVPLNGWLDRSLAAMNGLEADAAAPSPGEMTGVARMTATAELDGAVIRRDRFPAERWVFAPDAQVVDTRDHPMTTCQALLKRRRITVVDANVPMPDRDGGSVRMHEILAILAPHADVTFVAAEGRKLEPYCTQMRRAGIDVVLDEGEAVSRFQESATIWIARPSCADRFLARARAASPRARIVYDTVDLHYLREQRAGEAQWEATRALEMGAIQGADIVVAVSETERAIVDAFGARRSIVVPTIQREVSGMLPWAERSGLLFVGSFDHAPNVDAAMFLAKEIMPAVWKHAPSMMLTIAGSNPSRAIRALRRGRVRVVGFVPNLDPLLRSHRLSVAPLRFGAGLKAKVTQAFAYGLPVIGTTIAAEGFEGVVRDAITIADEAAPFARAILDTYEDEAVWTRAALRARAAAEGYTASAVSEAVRVAAGDGSRSG